MLNGDECRIELFGELVHYVDVVLEGFVHGIIAVGAEHERLHEYELTAALIFCVLEDVLIVGSVLLYSYCLCLSGVVLAVGPPEVVYSNHDTENIGFLIYAVSLPSPFESSCGIAVDAAVEYL